MSDEEKEESIEELFSQFVNAVKALPKEDKDKMVKNLNSTEQENK